jgi:hypothetical protein
VLCAPFGGHQNPGVRVPLSAFGFLSGFGLQISDLSRLTSAATTNLPTRLFMIPMIPPIHDSARWFGIAPRHLMLILSSIPDTTSHDSYSSQASPSALCILHSALCIGKPPSFRPTSALK